MTAERRLVIAIDCDDVIVPTAHKVIEHYGMRYGHEVDPARFYDGTEVHWGARDTKEVNRRIERYFRQKSHELMTPFSEALIAIPALAKVHELHIVTGRANFMEPFTRQMIEESFPDCFESIEHTNFFKHRHRRSKGQVCSELGAHVLIDDHILHGQSVLEAGVEEVIVFGDYPWNQAETLPSGMTRCNDWPSTEIEVERIARSEFSQAG